MRIDASGRDIRLEVDGSIKIDNIRRVAKAGADTFVAGSAIFGQNDYRKKVIAAMRAQLRAVMALQSAIVDLDGTMVDTLGDFVVALNATLADLHLPSVGRAFIAETIGRGSEHLLQTTLATVGADAALYDDAWARYQHHYRAINGEYANVFDGVAEGLEWLSAHGLPLACLTNKPAAFAQALLARKGLDRHFRFVFGGDAFERRKPDPLPLLEACKALGTPRARDADGGRLEQRCTRRARRRAVPSCWSPTATTTASRCARSMPTPSSTGSTRWLRPDSTGRAAHP